MLAFFEQPYLECAPTLRTCNANRMPGYLQCRFFLALSHLKKALCPSLVKPKLGCVASTRGPLSTIKFTKSKLYKTAVWVILSGYNCFSIVTTPQPSLSLPYLVSHRKVAYTILLNKFFHHSQTLWNLGDLSDHKDVLVPFQQSTGTWLWLNAGRQTSPTPPWRPSLRSSPLWSEHHGDIMCDDSISSGFTWFYHILGFYQCLHYAKYLPHWRCPQHNVAGGSGHPPLPYH